MDDPVPMTPSYTDDPLLGTLIAGRYRILQVIGEGGAGRVYRAVQEAMGRDVAVKMLRYDVNAESQREFSSRFAREAALLGRLAHPNVVTVHDYGASEAGEQFVVMELLRGDSLKEIVRDGPLDPGRAATIAEGIARGLAHAHAAGLIHRDIKPSNIHLVAEGDGRERPVILDFGLVKGKESDDDVTRTGTYMGTPAYTAPEQARGDPNLDHRADLYALGVLLYRMLAGTVPYQGTNPMGTVILHITEPYPPIVKTAPRVRVDPMLEDIVRKAMEKLPDDRYADATELARALEAWRTGLGPIAASPRARGWAMPLLGGLGAGLLALVAATGGLIALAALAFAISRGSKSDEMIAPATAADPVKTAPVAVDPPAPPPVIAIADPPAPAEPPTTAPVEVPRPKPTVPKPKPVAEKPADPPRERPVAKPPSADGLTFDAITFQSPAHVAAALAWVNTATEVQLREARVYDRGVTVILANRPFASMQKFADTSGIGEATVRVAAQAAKP